MNKKVIIAVVVVLVLILGGLFYFKNASKELNSNMVPKDVFTSVKDALSKKMTLVCEFKNDTGASTKSYIKNGAVRVSTTNEISTNQSDDIIIKDKKMYMWDLKTKQGFVYDIPDESTNNQADATGSDVIKSDAYFKMIDKYKDSCKVATVEDSYFVPPTDVKFQEMNKLLEDIKKQMPQVPQSN